ncbi:MAG: hypothetical protein H0U95_15955 [Bacteroidetes bacterium]|nr:hypothetical protein [Bacteroidota bacterium]
MSQTNNDAGKLERQLLNIFNGLALGIILIIGFPIMHSTTSSSILSALIGCVGFVVNAALAFATKSNPDSRFYQMAVVWSFALPITGIYLFVNYYWK